MAMPSNPAAAKPPRVMVDATVLFAGIGWPRWSYEVLRHAFSGDYQLVLSPLVIEQARRNLGEKLPVLVGAFDAWLNLVPCDGLVKRGPGKHTSPQLVTMIMSVLAEKLTLVVTDYRNLSPTIRLGRVHPRPGIVLYWMA